MTPRNGDIILVSGQSLFAKAIKLFQVEQDGLGAAGHAAVACQAPDGSISVIEAEWTVRESSWQEFLAARKDSHVAVVSRASLAQEARDRIVRHVRTYLGEPYSVRRLLAMAVAKVSGWRLDLKIKGDRPVCSYLAAKPYYVEAGIEFDGADYKACTPDDIADHAKKCAPDWSITWID